MRSKKTVKITLEFVGPMRLPAGGQVLQKRFPSGTSVKDILFTAGYSIPEMKALQIIGGDKLLGLEEKVESDAKLKVFLRLGGG